MNNAQLVIDEVKKAVKGKDDCIIKAFAAFLAGGHILLEDVPGVGKTTLAVAFSRAMALVNHRVQFTPDVLPADILGFSMYQKQTGEFVYREGAVMCNLFLADEINRTSPKTQSALLEVMEEGLGVSPRGTIACVRMAKAYAYLSGRSYVIPSDVVSVFADVTKHRIVLNTKARVSHVSELSVIDEILKAVKQPTTYVKKAGNRD